MFLLAKIGHWDVSFCSFQSFVGVCGLYFRYHFRRLICATYQPQNCSNQGLKNNKKSKKKGKILKRVHLLDLTCSMSNLKQSDHMSLFLVTRSYLIYVTRGTCGLYYLLGNINLPSASRDSSGRIIGKKVILKSTFLLMIHIIYFNLYIISFHFHKMLIHVCNN